MAMIGGIHPAFAEAEASYRLERLRASYPRRVRGQRPARRGGLAGLLSWGGRPNPASPPPAGPPAAPAVPCVAGAPHYLVKGR